jgi:hypothetical protein
MWWYLSPSSRSQRSNVSVSLPPLSKNEEEEENGRKQISRTRLLGIYRDKKEKSKRVI